MKKRFLAFLLLPGAFIVIAIGGILVVTVFMRLRSQIETGDPNIDRFRTRIALGTIWHFALNRPLQLQAIARALVAIVNNETKGRAPPQIGDKQSALGPSVGPGQILRATAIDLKLVPQDTMPEEYMNYASDENWGIDAMIVVFKNKLEIANGDIGKAIQLYNGSGPAAENYRGDAFTWLGETFGDNPLGVAEVGTV